MPFTTLFETGHALSSQCFDNRRLYMELTDKGRWDVDRARESLRKANIEGLEELSDVEVFNRFNIQMTGVKQRYFISDESVEDLATEAAKQTLGGEKPDLVITPNFTDPRAEEINKIPNTALCIANALGNDIVPAFSMNTSSVDLHMDVPLAFVKNDFGKVLLVTKEDFRGRPWLNVWLVTKDGIPKIQAKSGSLEDLALAGRELLRREKVKPSELDLVIYSVATEDDLGSAVSKRLGLGGLGLSVNTACAGFPYGAAIADAFIRAGNYKDIVVSAAEKMSSVTDFGDYKTVALFGDAAGAARFKVTGDKSRAIRTFLSSNYSRSEITLRGDGDTAQLTGGSQILKNAIRSMEFTTYMLALQEVGHSEKYSPLNINQIKGKKDLMEKIKQQLGKVAMIIPHDANLRIDEGLIRSLKQLGLSEEQFYFRIQKEANCSGSSAPKNLDFARKEGPLQLGDIVYMPCVGGGYTMANLKLVMP